jgi:hypothetical protein
MRQQDAQDILRIIESLWSIDLGKDTRDAWRGVLMEFDDAALVTEAVISLAKSEVYRPSLALIRMKVHKMQADKAPGHRVIPWTRQELPLWVKRWFYARFRATPPDMRVFPEQASEISGEPMPEDAYVKEAQEITHADVQGAFAAGKHV